MDPDCIILTETKVDSSVYTSESMPNCYTCFRKDRCLGGGRVLVGIKSSFAPVETDLLDNKGEVVWAQVILRNQKKLFIGAFYRKPDNTLDQLEYLDQSLSTIGKLTRNNVNSTTILAGDFNAGNIDWSTDSVKPNCDRAAIHNKLLSVLNDHHLEQQQKLPTREQNVLDLYCTNKPTLTR